MQIYGYPGDRVDFVSKSGSAGSIVFGDSADLVEEFFGPAHTKEAEVYTYFNGSIALGFDAGKVRDIIITPQASREKIEVFLGKEKLNGLSPDKLETLTQGTSSSVVLGADKEIETVTFAG